MNFGLTDDQQMLRDTIARFLDSESAIPRVRQAIGTRGFDAQLWAGLAELGIFGLRVPADVCGLGLGTLDAAILMEEFGRTLASGPIAEALIAANVLARLGALEDLAGVLDGSQVVTLAFHDIAARPVQWLSGGAHADAAIARRGGDVVLVRLSDTDRRRDETLASNGIGEVDLGKAASTILASGEDTCTLFAAALEEWSLLTAALLNGLAREAIRLAAGYAGDRMAFGVPIGTYQAMSHPLANLFVDVEGGRLLTWQVIHAIAADAPDAAAQIPLALWWNARTAARAGIQSLRTFGGYGLTTEYDIHLYNLRAKAAALVRGDPAKLLVQAGRRLYAGETAPLPDVGPVSIDFDLGPEAADLARELDAFFTETLTPELKVHAHYSWEGHHPEVHRKLGQRDLLFPAWPKAKGGRGASPYASYAAAAVWEEHEWTSHARGTTQMVAAMIDKFGSEELRRDVLPAIMRGEAICSLGYSEPGSGSDVFAAQTKAIPQGNGWRIDGTKMFTSGANLADYVLMLTRTNCDLPKHKGLTMFLVPLRGPGVTIQPVHTFQDERTNITFYDDVTIDDAWRLGEIDGGIRVMSAGLEMEHGGGGFVKVQRALVRKAETLCRAIAGDDGRPLLAQAAAQARLAKAHAHYQISQMLGLRSLWAVEEKIEVAAAGPMSKLFSSEKLLEDAEDLLDLTAPLSLSKRPGAAAFLNQTYRHAHGTTIYAGTSEIHRSMIAERALGLPRSRA